MKNFLFLSEIEQTGKGDVWTVWLVLLCVIPIAILIITAIVLSIYKSKIKANDYDEEDSADYSQKEVLASAYGGEDNIISVSLEMSRITVKVKDIDLVEAEKLKELGAKNVLLVNDEVKSSFGDLAKNIYKILEKK